MTESIAGTRVRDAGPEDAAACAAIYAPYVTDTVITFETDPPGPTEMRGRITGAHAWVVAEDAERIVGYACGTEHKARAAYRWSCEVSVYLEPGLRRTGAGRALYEALFERLVARGLRMAVAGMTLPNEASGPAPRPGLRADRRVPPDRVEERCLARRGVGAAGAGRRRRASRPRT